MKLLIITLWRGDKQLTSRVLDSYPRTKPAVLRKAKTTINEYIKELEAINQYIIEELDYYSNTISSDKQECHESLSVNTIAL